MHNRVDQWLDTVSSPRFPWEQVDRAINTAIDTTVNDRYYPYDPRERERAFQTVQRIRDELYTLIKTAPAIPVSGTDLIPLAGVPDYRFLLSLTVYIDNAPYPTEPTTYDESESEIILDPYKRPHTDYPSLVLRNETKEGIRINWGQVGILTGGILTYLKNPEIVNFQNQTNCDLPVNLHEEICKMASEILKSQSINLVAQRQG